MGINIANGGSRILVIVMCQSPRSTPRSIWKGNFFCVCLSGPWGKFSYGGTSTPLRFDGFVRQTRRRLSVINYWTSCTQMGRSHALPKRLDEDSAKHLQSST